MPPEQTSVGARSYPQAVDRRFHREPEPRNLAVGRNLIRSVTREVPCSPTRARPCPSASTTEG